MGLPLINLKTDDAMLARLHGAVRKRLSQDEIKNQRVSFIMGSLNADNRVTREEVEKILAWSSLN